MVFTLIPLAIAVIITSIMGVIIWRYSNTILEQSGWLFVKTKRFARFAGLVFVTMLSAALYTGVISLWVRAHRQSRNHDPAAWRDANPVAVRFSHASVLWEGMFGFSSSICENRVDLVASYDPITIFLHLRCTG